LLTMCDDAVKLLNCVINLRSESLTRKIMEFSESTYRQELINLYYTALYLLYYY